jgi:DNA-binding TFAR19-related protein (PDSD5 family)
MSQWGIEARCTVHRFVTVEAETAEEAEEEFVQLRWVDQIEQEMTDWEMRSPPKEDT